MDDTNQNTEEIPELKLSVIVPARNEEQSLPACLTSFVQQSEVGFALGVEWEIIVVNDDSTDRTREIAAGLQPDIPELYCSMRLRWI